MNRRILLIDSDPTFRTTLTISVQKYRIDVIHEPDADEAIAMGATEPPALVVVGVEEPEKAGFKVFQRLKKGPLSKVPIMLVTGTVSAESFAKHKGLKTHAEEYVDKHTSSKDELAAKIDALIGLGEQADDDLDIPVEVDDINVGDGNVIDEEVPPDAEYASDQKTMMGGPDRIDASVAEDVDDAFAGLMGGGGDDAPSLQAMAPPPRPEVQPQPPSVLIPRNPPATIPSPVEAEADDGTQDFDNMPSTRADIAATMSALRSEHTTAPPPIATADEPVHLGTPPAREEREEVSVVAEAIPAPIEDGGHRDDEDDDGFDDFSKNKPYPIDDVIASHDIDGFRPVDTLAAEAVTPSALESQPAIQLDAGDVELLEEGDIVVEDDADSGGVPEPVPHPRSADDAAEAAVVQSQPKLQSSSPSIDLGLEKVAEAANMEQQSGGYPATSDDRDQSGVYDRRALRKIGELERQIMQLKTELERARATAETAAKGGGREQTFLNLREKMMAADNELKKARAELGAREEELSDLQGRVATLQEQRQSFEGKSGDLEQKLAAEATKAAASAKQEHELGQQVKGLESELDEKAGALAQTEKARAQLEGELASERALRAASASDAERQLRVEREQIVGKHQGELAALRQELQGRQDAALEQLRAELDANHAGAIAAAIEATRGEVGAEAEEAVAQIEAQREADIAALRSEHEAQLARMRGELESTATRTKGDLEHQLSTLKSEYETLLAHTKSESDSKLARTQRELEAQLADAHAQIDAANARHEEGLAQAASTHAAELANQANQHAAALATRERELASARQDDAIAHTAALAELKTELDKAASKYGLDLGAVKREMDELAALHEQNKAEILDEQKAAQARLAEAHAAELARVEADRQRAQDDIARAAASHKTAIEHTAEQHKEELRATREAADREVAELRQVLLGAKRQLEEATTSHKAERDQLAQQHEHAIAENKAQHERAMAVANGEIVKVKAVADSEHNRAIAALKAEHAAALKEVTTERDELKRGLSAARDTIKRSESELATAVQTIADRNAELRGANAGITERDGRIAELRKEIEAIEQENANYQEQVLRAYQKIKSDEAMVARAKKAMAIALTVLDDQGAPKSEPT